MEISPHEKIVACDTCGMVQRMDDPQPGTRAQCCRCAAPIDAGTRRHSLETAAALTLGALILYVPANIYPILSMTVYGAYSQNTIWDGCVALFRDGQWFVAGIVFLASIMVPLLKLLGLFYLIAAAKFRSTRLRRERTWIYRTIAVIGPWAMLDVFLLAILVALVKLQQLVSVMPGRGLLAFTAMVVLTILASASFDPKLIWEQPA